MIIRSLCSAVVCSVVCGPLAKDFPLGPLTNRADDLLAVLMLPYFVLSFSWCGKYKSIRISLFAWSFRLLQTFGCSFRLLHSLADAAFQRSFNPETVERGLLNAYCLAGNEEEAHPSHWRSKLQIFNCGRLIPPGTSSF